MIHFHHTRDFESNDSNRTYLSIWFRSLILIMVRSLIKIIENGALIILILSALENLNFGLGLSPLPKRQRNC